MSTFDTNVPAPDAPIWSTAVKYGLIAGVVSGVLTMLFYNMGMTEPGNTSGTIISTIATIAITFAILFLGLKAYRDSANNGQLSFGRGVLWSLGYGLIAALIGIVFTYVFFAYLAPEYMENAIELQVVAFEEQGMSDEEIEAATSMMGTFMNPVSMAVFGAFGQVFYAVIQGLIASLILKTR